MKYCPNCGSQVEEGAQFCNICGARLVQPQVQNANPNPGYNPGYQYNQMNNIVPAQTGINVQAIVGFVMAFAFYPVGLVFSILGLVNANKTNHGRGYAIAGIIISAILLLGEISNILLV